MRIPIPFLNRKSKDPLDSVSQTYFTRSQSGVSVTSESALKSSAVYAGIRYHGQTVGQLPWGAYRPSKQGKGNELITKNEFAGITNVLNRRVNQHMSSQQFREVMISHAILYGNGVAEIERATTGRATALYILNPERLKFESDGETVEYIYQDPRRGEIVFSETEVFRISCYGTRPDMPMLGQSVIEFAAESIGWQQATELFGAAYFRNGVHPSGMITLKNALTPEAYKLFSESLEEKFSGSRGAHKPFITDGEASYTKFGIQANEAQFVETLQHQIDDIARWIGVPPSKIGHMIHSGVRANVEHESIAVVQDHTMPWVRRFENEADIKLFRDNENLFTRMDLTALLRGDSVSRAQYYQTMRNMGALNADEIREMEDFNPIPDGSGQIYVMQGQYLPLSQIGDQSRDQGIPNDNRPAQSGERTTDGGAQQGGATNTAEEEFSDEEADREFRRTLHLQRD